MVKLTNLKLTFFELACALWAALPAIAFAGSDVSDRAIGRSIPTRTGLPIAAIVTWTNGPALNLSKVDEPELESKEQTVRSHSVASLRVMTTTDSSRMRDKICDPPINYVPAASLIQCQTSGAQYQTCNTQCQTCGAADGRTSTSTLGAVLCMGLFVAWKFWGKKGFA
jgi:hypothetical protein